MANNAIENAEKILELTEKQEKLKKIIANYAKTISEQEGKASEHQKARLNGLKIAFETRKKELKIAQDITDTQEELRSLTDKEAMASFDIAAHKKKILKTADSIRKLESLGTKDAIQKADKLKEELKMTKGVFDRRKDAISAVQAQEKITENLLGNLNTSVGALSGMKDQAILFGRALMANPYLALLAGFALLIMYIKDSVSFSIKLSKELGVSASQASKLNNEIGFVRRKFLDMVGIDVSAISNQLLEDFGDVNMLSGKTVEQIGTMALGMGTTGQNLVKVSKTMQSVLPSISNSAMAMESMSMFAAIAKENGAATGKVMDDLAENTEVFAAFGKDGGENIAMAAIQARKLGLNLSQTAKIADSLLDFESSIEKEMEASLLIGKQLNYNRARQLALEGDIAGAAKEVMDQIGGQEEFSRLNVIQRRALADSIGVSVDELSRLASGDLNVSSDAKEPMDAVAEGQKMLSDAMGGVEKAVSTATFALKQTTKFLEKRAANKAAKEAGEKIAKEGTEAAVKAAVKTIAKVPIAKTTGLPDMRSAATPTKVLKKELGEDAAQKVLSTVAKEGGEQALETGSKLLVKNTVGKIPIASAVLGTGLAIKELMEGDVVGAIGEFTSGLAATIPGYGTAASVAIDATLLGRDIMAANETLTTLQAELEKEKQNLTTEELKLVEEAARGSTEKQQEFIDKFDKWFGGGSMNDIAEIMAKLIEEEKKTAAAVTGLGAD
tara:strand:- start:1117 stop:3300 length:2184 start_codon:yes stop_codon:yes gene_type:complete